MEWLQFREPFSAWSHAVGLLLALPATVALVHRANGNPLKRFGFLVFGFCLAACYGGSTLFHAAQGTPARLAWFCTLDHIGIYLLIAGTITPVALVVLQGRWRRGTLAMAWLLAACGIAMCFTVHGVSLPVATALYLAMGWGILACYFELARILPPRSMNLALAGGLLYTTGAVLNVMHWPTLWPGVVGPHEVFHLFVLAGTTAHFLFALQVVAPFERPAVVVEPARAAVAACRLAGAAGGAHP